MIETVVGWGFVRLPGLIFTLDLDGIIWLLTVKLLFWILGLILSIICFILAITLGYITSLFVYPFAIAKSFSQNFQKPSAVLGVSDPITKVGGKNLQVKLNSQHFNYCPYE